MTDWPFLIGIRMLINVLLKAVGPDYICAHKHCSWHRNEIERSERCGCFYYLQTFAAKDIQEWIDDGATAKCPHCGIDSVIGSASGFSMSLDFLRRMHEYWFDRTYKVSV